MLSTRESSKERQAAIAAGEGGADEFGHPNIEHGEGAAGVW